MKQMVAKRMGNTFKWNENCRKNTNKMKKWKNKKRKINEKQIKVQMKKPIKHDNKNEQMKTMNKWNKCKIKW